LRSRLLIGLLCLLPAIACAPEPEGPPPLVLNVGIHDISLALPEGWIHLDHGLEHRFQNDLRHIAISDLGPVTPEGYQREINHARELFRDYRLEDAKAHLDSIQLLAGFSSARHWAEVSGVYHVALDGGLKRDSTRQEVEDAYTSLIQQVERMERSGLPSLVERLLPTLDTAAHREVASQQHLTIGGRDGMRVETWDKMTHESRLSFLFVLNEENMLVLRMAFGKQPDMQEAYDLMADSLRFQAPAAISP
jgi:hypothetical protein